MHKQAEPGCDREVRQDTGTLLVEHLARMIQMLAVLAMRLKLASDCMKTARSGSAKLKSKKR